MSNNKTAETDNTRPFEDRVFARFDALEDRVERLEMKQYDTRPMWEQAIAAITEISESMQSGFAKVGGQLDLVNSRLDSIEMRLTEHDKRFELIDARFDSVDARFDSIDARFDSIDARFDSIDARFDSIDARFETVDARSDSLRTALDDGLRRVERKLDVLNDEFLELKADQRYVDRRLEKIESQSKSS